MDVHINKKIAGLMIFSVIVGAVVGGAIGFMASEEDHGEREGQGIEQGYFDDHADGETNDDQGGAPNQDAQKSVMNTMQNTSPASTPTTPTTPISAQ